MGKVQYFYFGGRKKTVEGRKHFVANNENWKMQLQESCVNSFLHLFDVVGITPCCPPEHLIQNWYMCVWRIQTTCM